MSALGQIFWLVVYWYFILLNTLNPKAMKTYRILRQKCYLIFYPQEMRKDGKQIKDHS